MANSTLVIPNVDTSELEKQRLALGSLDLSRLSQVQREAVSGLCEMLDYWSDRSHRIYTVILTYPIGFQLIEQTPYIETLEAANS